MKDKRFQQTKFWAEFKGAHNWKPLFFSDEVTVLLRSFSFLKKSFSLAYIPLSPEMESDSSAKGIYSESDALSYVKKINEISLELKQKLPKDTMFIRFDPPMEFGELTEKDSFIQKIKSVSAREKIPLVVREAAVQPPDSVILDLTAGEQELLSQMKSKWRYNIRLAEKKGVKVNCFHSDSQGFEEAFDSFYELFETTGKRDGISPHDKSYYLDLLKKGNGSNEADVRLYMAEHEGENLAGIITLFCKREAVYLFGASGNNKRNLMPSYLLQWTAIKDAMEAGCPLYDFYGIPPVNDESHPMHGLYLFKTGFGGKIIHRTGSFDIPLNGFYRLYLMAESLRSFYHKTILKKIRGR